MNRAPRLKQLAEETMRSQGYRWDAQTGAWRRRKIMLLDWGRDGCWWVFYFDGKEVSTHRTLDEAVRAAERYS